MQEENCEGCSQKVVEYVSSFGVQVILVCAHRRASPPVREPQPYLFSQPQTTGRRDSALTPVMRALIELEGTKATEGKALSKTSRSSISTMHAKIQQCVFFDCCWVQSAEMFFFLFLVSCLCVWVLLCGVCNVCACVCV